MLTETGQVVAIEADGLWIETLKQSACAKCAGRHGCGQKLLAKGMPGTNMTFIRAIFSEGVTKEGWQVGDSAVVGVQESALVKGAAFVYLLPLITMLTIAYLATTVIGDRGEGDTFAALGALIGLLIGGVLVRIHAKIVKYDPRYQPVVLAKSSAAENSGGNTQLSD